MKGATIGMFDGVHLGHQHMISQLKAVSDDAVVVTFRNHPLGVVDSSREPKLLSTADEKERLLRSLGVTPVILPFDEPLRRMTAEEFIGRLAREYGIERMLLGFNNSIGSDRCSSDEDLRRVSEATGVEIVRATELPGKMTVNSSTIRNLIGKGDIAHANDMLGRPYSISGEVVHGKALGRTIGFPTANIEIGDPHKLIPGTGVYAADAILPDCSSYRAVVNIGRRPTVDSDGAKLSIEAYLDGFDGNLYGREITLRLIARLRGEKRFSGLGELKDAIAGDVTAARGIG